MIDFGDFRSAAHAGDRVKMIMLLALALNVEERPDLMFYAQDMLGMLPSRRHLKMYHDALSIQKDRDTRRALRSLFEASVVDWGWIVGEVLPALASRHTRELVCSYGAIIYAQYVPMRDHASWVLRGNDSGLQVDDLAVCASLYHKGRQNRSKSTHIAISKEGELIGCDEVYMFDSLPLLKAKWASKLKSSKKAAIMGAYALAFYNACKYGTNGSTFMRPPEMCATDTTNTQIDMLNSEYSA